MWLHPWERLGYGPLTPHCLVIAPLGLAGSPTTPEEGSPDYSLWVGSPYQKAFNLLLPPEDVHAGSRFSGHSL